MITTGVNNECFNAEEQVTIQVFARDESLEYITGNNMKTVRLPEFITDILFLIFTYIS